MRYLFLLLTILAESAAVICMELSNGFQHRTASIAAAITYLLSFVFLTLALKYLPAGIANAVWAGASTLLVAVIGIWLFREYLTPLQWFFLLLIVIGLAGLNGTARI